MAKHGFSVTFERYFPHDEGDDICEADETGFVIEGASLRDAMQDGLEHQDSRYAGACEADSYPARGVRFLTFHRWNFESGDHFRDGITEVRSLHIPDRVTEASRRRICRLFGVRT